MTVNSFVDGLNNWMAIENRDNRLEHIDISYTSISPRGWNMRNITVVGFNKLETLTLRGTNKNKVFNINLTDAQSLTTIDQSQSQFEDMAEEEFSLIFSKPIGVSVLNLSS